MINFTRQTRAQGERDRDRDRGRERGEKERDRCKGGRDGWWQEIVRAFLISKEGRKEEERERERRRMVVAVLIRARSVLVQLAAERQLERQVHARPRQAEFGHRVRRLLLRLVGVVLLLQRR